MNGPKYHEERNHSLQNALETTAGIDVLEASADFESTRLGAAIPYATGGLPDVGELKGRGFSAALGRLEAKESEAKEYPQGAEAPCPTPGCELLIRGGT